MWLLLWLHRLVWAASMTSSLKKTDDKWVYLVKIEGVYHPLMWESAEMQLNVLNMTNQFYPGYLLAPRRWLSNPTYDYEEKISSMQVGRAFTVKHTFLS